MPLGKLFKSASRKPRKLADEPAKAVREIVKKTINQKLETKYHDFDSTATPTPVLLGGVNSLIAQVPDGVLVTERVGRTIRANRVEIRGKLTMLDPVNMQLPYTVRIVLYRDNQEGTQSSLLIPDVIETGAGPTMQQYQFDHVPSRFEILKDFRITVDPLHEPREKPFYINIRKNMIMSFNGAGGGASGKGRLVLAFCSEASTAPTAPHVQFTSRLWFKDA